MNKSSQSTEMKSFRTFSLSTLLASLLASTIASAGNEGGNGGDAVVCRNTSTQQIRSIELLDYYEARTLRGITPDFGPATGDYRQKIEFALQRFAASAPRRSGRYLEWAKSFENESNFLRGVQLVDVPDSAHVALPVGCAIEQLVIQKVPQFAEDKRYTVNADLWDALSDTDKAGIVLHEVVFREALTFRHRNSIASRYLNSYISAGKSIGATSRERVEFFQRLEFRSADVQGIEVLIGELNTSLNGTTRYVINKDLHFNSTGIAYGAISAAEQALTLGSGELKLLENAILSFSAKGKLIRVAGIVEGRLTQRGLIFQCSKPTWEGVFFTEDDQIERIVIGGLKDFQVELPGIVSLGSSGQLELNGGYGVVQFWPNGNLAEVNAHGCWVEWQGRRIRLDDTPISLNESGRILQVGSGAIVSLRGGSAKLSFHDLYSPDWKADVWHAEWEGTPTVQIGGLPATLKGEVRFYPRASDRLVTVTLAKDAMLYRSNGRKYLFRAWCRLHLDAQTERVTQSYCY